MPRIEVQLKYIEFSSVTMESSSATSIDIILSAMLFEHSGE